MWFGRKIMGFEELDEFYNCLTIYYLYWLGDILVVCRSDCRSRFGNCLEILNNFGDGVRVEGYGFR